MLDLGSFGISRKLTTPTFQWNKVCGDLSSGDEIVVFRIRAVGLISLLAVYFTVKIPSNSEMLLTNRDNQLLGNLTIFENILAFMDHHGAYQEDFVLKGDFKMGLLLSKTLSKILLNVGLFSAISVKTSSFQVCFEPINYQFEGLHVLLQMTANWATNS